MKIPILFILSLVAAVASSSAQNALMDAIQLRAMADPTYQQNEQTVMKLTENCAACETILRRYVPDSERVVFDGFTRTRNPFIGKREQKNKILFPQVFNTLEENKDAAEAMLPAPARSSGLFVNNVADGLAKFLVNRTKEELSIAFFSRFQRDVAENQNLRVILPATAGVFQTIDKDIYRYNLFLQALRQGFQRDLKSLPVNFQAGLEQGQIIKSPQWQIAIHDALQLSQLLLDRRSPDSVFLYLGRDAYLQTATDKIAAIRDTNQQRQVRNLAATLQLSHLISESLRTSESGKTWMSGKQIVEALRDSATMYLYLGLLWQQGTQNIKFQANHKMVDFRDVLNLIGSSQERKSALQQYLNTFATAGEGVSNRLNAIKGQSATQVQPYDQVYEFFNLFFGLIEQTMTFKTQFIPGASQEMDATFVGTLRQLNDLNFNVRQRYYSAAVTNIGAILTTLVPENPELRQKILKYGFFMASVSEAENSDQVAAAIEAVALPPGSSVMKKQTSWSAALNAYTGLAGGQERLLDAGIAPSGFASVAAPVGITISKGFGNRGSMSLLIPVIDVGALVAFRFQNDQANLLPKLSWSNIVAPGAYLAYGFFNNLPITIGAGAQLGPNLRGIEPNTVTTDVTAGGWRWGGFISVDIPIFNLYSR
jgi:hypothetical protein